MNISYKTFQLWGNKIIFSSHYAVKTPIAFVYDGFVVAIRQLAMQR